MRVCRIATCSGKLIMLSRFPYRLINHNRKLEIHMDGYGVIHPRRRSAKNRGAVNNR